jgi:hypothetical protein
MRSMGLPAITFIGIGDRHSVYPGAFWESVSRATGIYPHVPVRDIQQIRSPPYDMGL